jgi:hypothetical protein
MDRHGRGQHFADRRGSLSMAWEGLISSAQYLGDFVGMAEMVQYPSSDNLAHRSRHVPQLGFA